MRRVFSLFVFLALSAFLLGIAGYKALHVVMPHGFVFGGLYRMFMYHESHPSQYVGIMALTYGTIATSWILRWPELVGWRQSGAIAAIILASILVASVPGGVLWKIHDMQAGFFTQGGRFWRDLLWGAATGLEIGWMVMALSLPYNILGLIAGYGITRLGFRIARSKAEPDAPGNAGGPVYSHSHARGPASLS